MKDFNLLIPEIKMGKISHVIYYYQVNDNYVWWELWTPLGEFKKISFITHLN